jgi:DUF4097 and DUF4098 domain-containing protein YvlB
MNPMIKAVIVTSFLVAGCNLQLGPNAKHTGTQRHQLMSTTSAAVDVKSRNGDVFVHADSSVKHAIIEVEIKAGGATDGEAKARYDNVKVSAKEVGGVLEVRVSFPQPGFSNDGADFTVTIPEMTGVAVSTSNGDVEVLGANGTISLDSSNGDVTLLDSEGITVIETSNGDVTVRDFTGSLEVDTSNGEIVVVLSEASAEGVNLGTSNSDIQLTVGAKFIGTITGTTSNGRVEITDSSGRATASNSGKGDGSVTLGEGQPSHLSTSNGSIDVIVN